MAKDPYCEVYKVIFARAERYGREVLVKRLGKPQRIPAERRFVYRSAKIRLFRIRGREQSAANRKAHGSRVLSHISSKYPDPIMEC
jgi:hypothetical protein